MKKLKILNLFLSLLMVFTVAFSAQPVMAEGDGTVKITAVDSSGVSLSGYDFVLTNSGSRVNVSGSNGVYTVGGQQTLITSNGGIIHVSGLDSGNYTVSYVGADSSLRFSDVSFSISGSQTSYVTITGVNQVGSLVMKLTGEGSEPLSNVKFHISRNGQNVRFSSNGSSYVENSNGASDVYTDSSGQINISSLQPGSYQIVQDSMPYGYNSSPINEIVNVSVGSNTNVSYRNSKIYGSFSVLSQDDSGHKVTSVVNILSGNKTLSFFSDGNNNYEYTPTAGSQDITISEAANFTQLPYGDYTVVVKSVEGSFDKAQNASVRVDSSDRKQVKIANPSKGTKLTITAKEDGEGVQNFLFEISSEKKIKFNKAGDGVYEYSQNGNLEELTTPQSGIIVVSGIPEGKYTVSSKKSNGFKDSKEKKTVNLKLNSPETLDFKAESLGKKSLNIDSESPLSFQGALLTITDSNNKEVLSETLSTPGSIDISNLDAGKYTYEISDLPDGYLNKSYKNSFTIKANEEFKSPTIKLESTSIKVDVDSDVEQVSLFDNDGEEVTVDVENGKAEFKDIMDGKYIVKVGDEEKIVTVDRDFKGESIDFRTTTPSEDVQLPVNNNTEDLDINKNKFNWWWLLLIPLILICALLGLLFKNKKHKKVLDVKTDPETASSIDNALISLSAVNNGDNVSDETVELDIIDNTQEAQPTINEMEQLEADFQPQESSAEINRVNLEDNLPETQATFPPFPTDNELEELEENNTLEFDGQIDNSLIKEDVNPIEFESLNLEAPEIDSPEILEEPQDSEELKELEETLDDTDVLEKVETNDEMELDDSPVDIVDENNTSIKEEIISQLPEKDLDSTTDDLDFNFDEPIEIQESEPIKSSFSDTSDFDLSDFLPDIEDKIEDADVTPVEETVDNDESTLLDVIEDTVEEVKSDVRVKSKEAAEKLKDALAQIKKES